MLGYWIFAACYLMTIAYLVYLIERQRRRIDDILFQIEIINDTHALMWKHILKEEKHDAKEGEE